MTLGEENSCIMNAAYEFEAGDLLKQVLLQAKVENRVTCGIYQVASKLNMNSKSVMMCLHADDCVAADDVLQMHFALMKAYCWENTIPLMKVFNQSALYELLKDLEIPRDQDEEGNDLEDFGTAGSVAVTSEDTVCVLIEMPDHKSETEDSLLRHHRNMAQHTSSPKARLAT